MYYIKSPMGKISSPIGKGIFYPILTPLLSIFQKVYIVHQWKVCFFTQKMALFKMIICIFLNLLIKKSTLDKMTLPRIQDSLLIIVFYLQQCSKNKKVTSRTKWKVSLRKYILYHIDILITRRETIWQCVL